MGIGMSESANCPHCNAYAAQIVNGLFITSAQRRFPGVTSDPVTGGQYIRVCLDCNRLILPPVRVTPIAPQDKTVPITEFTQLIWDTLVAGKMEEAYKLTNRLQQVSTPVVEELIYHYRNMTIDWENKRIRQGPYPVFPEINDILNRLDANFKGTNIRL